MPIGVNEFFQLRCRQKFLDLLVGERDLIDLIETCYRQNGRDGLRRVFRCILDVLEVQLPALRIGLQTLFCSNTSSRRIL